MDFRVIFLHMIIQACFLNERFTALITNFSLVTLVFLYSLTLYSLVKNQIRLSNKSLLTKLTLEIFSGSVLKLVSLQTIQVECFIFTRITGVTPAKHVITTYVFTPLHLRVKNTFPSFTFIPIIDIVFFEFIDCEVRMCIEHFLAIWAGVSRHVIMFLLSY